MFGPVPYGSGLCIYALHGCDFEYILPYGGGKDGYMRYINAHVCRRYMALAPLEIRKDKRNQHKTDTDYIM